jgi:hypothetical protein
VPTVGVTPSSAADLSWRPSSAPTGLYGLGTGLLGAAGVECTARTHVALAAAVAPDAVNFAALPFVAPTFGAAALSTEATGTVEAVAGNQQVAVAPKQAKNPVIPTSTLVNFMRKNASPSGDRAGAPPS